MNAVPDREVAAQLAAFRRESVDLERRLRGDQLTAADSEEYWRSQIGLWRGLIERTLANYPIQLRAISQIPSGGEGGSWEETALEEIVEVRAKLEIAPGTDAELARRVVDKADRNCLVSNSLKASVHVVPTITIASEPIRALASV